MKKWVVRKETRDTWGNRECVRKQGINGQKFTIPKLRERPGNSEVVNASWVCFSGRKPVNSMWITGTITAKQKVRQKVPGLYAVCR